MASQKQIDANRANARKSTGPRTPEGKAVCSKNSRRHGLLAESILLSTENGKRFSRFIEKFYQEYQPEGPTESALVDMMGVARWRMLRMANLEAAGVDHEYQQLRNHADAALAIPVCATLAYRSLSDTSRSLELLGRFEARLQRQFDSAFDRLSRLRAERDRQFAQGGLVPPRGNPVTDPISNPGGVL